MTREKNFVISEMYPFWLQKGLSDRNADRFHRKAHKMGLDVVLIHEEFHKLISATIFAPSEKSGFELYKKSKDVEKVTKISAKIFGEVYGKTSMPITDEILIHYDDEFKKLSEEN